MVPGSKSRMGGHKKRFLRNDFVHSLTLQLFMIATLENWNAVDDDFLTMGSFCKYIVW